MWIGRIGSRIAADLAAKDIPFVIIENNPDKILELDKLTMLSTEGDAADESTLLNAGLAIVKGRILTLPEDCMNVFVSLLARELNEDIYILARAGKSGNRHRLIRVGANKVVSPYEIGAHRILQVILRPHVVRFMEAVFLNDAMDLSMKKYSWSRNHPSRGNRSPKAIRRNNSALL